MLNTFRERSTLLYYLALAVIIVLSYSLYASSYYPLLSSDDSLNILMAHFYKLPEDIYCWGQDRGGTVIPFISQFFIRVFGASAIDAVSLANYTVIVLGYIGFSSLLNKKWSRLLFALVWFFPFQRFVDLTRYPIGVQYSLIAFGIFLIRQIQFDNFNANRLRHHLLLFLAMLVFGLAVWASDLAAISLVLLFGVLYFHRIRKERTWKIRWEIPVYMIVGVGLFGALILYGKHQAVAFSPKQFSGLNSPAIILDGLSIIGIAFADALSYGKTLNPFIVLYAALVPVLIVTLVVLAFAKKVRIPVNQQRWLSYIGVDAICVFGVILLSEWVLVNGMGRWYFVGTYIMVALALLILLENLRLNKVWNRTIVGFATLIVLTGSISTPYDLQFVRPKTLRSTADEIRELDRLGEIGIIGDYWNAYKFAAINPDKIAATAFEGGNIRNIAMTGEVLNKPSIYIFPEGWVENFPDTIHQFGLNLIKKGKPFFIAGETTCRYVRQPLRNRYDIAPKYVDTNLVYQTPVKEELYLTPDMDSIIHKNLLSGIEVTLAPGNYVLYYRIRVEDVLDANAECFMLEVGSPYESIGSKGYCAADLKGNDFQTVRLELHVDHLIMNAGIHFFYRGNATVILDEIQLIER